MTRGIVRARREKRQSRQPKTRGCINWYDIIECGLNWNIIFSTFQIEYLSNESQSFLRMCQTGGHLISTQPKDDRSNDNAKSFLDYYRTDPSFSKAIHRLHGENTLPYSIITTTDGINFLIPPHCKFYNRDIRDLSGIDLTAGQHDLIVIDPPWWNKYIRRSRNTKKEYRWAVMITSNVCHVFKYNYYSSYRLFELIIIDKSILTIAMKCSAMTTLKTSRLNAIQNRIAPWWQYGVQIRRHSFKLS